MIIVHTIFHNNTLQLISKWTVVRIDYVYRVVILLYCSVSTELPRHVEDFVAVGVESCYYSLRALELCFEINIFIVGRRRRCN